ncbi:hypothetical protein RFI_06482 [Reticulomyxa filosa]|uniref:Uncharacterized protein n=1 Tax=Reticulomyxa filosa TaxID=46433 RepID=X6NXA3_RETFI|nr:hypothetical protein RFI_06482 [Reticulomyxa filosa]|eukprot:ETO30641.1 hypothetical protein RFI_06482 [Reticulomyxa filosa]
MEEKQIIIVNEDIIMKQAHYPIKKEKDELKRMIKRHVLRMPFEPYYDMTEDDDERIKASIEYKTKGIHVVKEAMLAAKWLETRKEVHNDLVEEAIRLSMKLEKKCVKKKIKKKSARDWPKELEKSNKKKGSGRKINISVYFRRELDGDTHFKWYIKIKESTIVVEAECTITDIIDQEGNEINLKVKDNKSVKKCKESRNRKAIIMKYQDMYHLRMIINNNQHIDKAKKCTVLIY